jgi:hypothetical protein
MIDLVRIVLDNNAYWSILYLVFAFILLVVGWLENGGET